MLVGAGGTGTLDVTAGGTVEAGSQVAGEDAFEVGAGAGGAGSVTVDGAGSTITIDGVLNVGDAGSGSLTLTHGGAVTVTSCFVGMALGGQGLIALADMGSALTLTGALDIGAATNGRLTIGTGASVHAGSVHVGSHGVVTLAGGTLYPPTAIVFDAGSVVQGAGTLDGNVVNNGTIQADGALTVTGSLIGAGTLIVGSGADVVLNGPVAFPQNIAFSASSGSLTLKTSAFLGRITGFRAGDNLVIQDFTPLSQTYSDGKLIFAGTGQTRLELMFEGSYAANSFAFDGGTITTSAIACYAAGTRILTAAGERPIETLRPGDLLPTVLGGGSAPIVWVGHRTVTFDRHPHATPIRIRAGALGGGLPTQDLLVSPEHAMLIDGRLVPARDLLNHTTIALSPQRRLTYWHIELAQHDCILAEGAASESWLDTGNRAMFDNSPVRTLEPWKAGAVPCAPGERQAA